MATANATTMTAIISRSARRRMLSALGALLAVAAVAAPAAQASTGGAGPARWVPQAATYGEGSSLNLPVTMSDGTVLRADVYYPTDPRTGREAAGRFPVLL